MSNNKNFKPTIEQLQASWKEHHCDDHPEIALVAVIEERYGNKICWDCSECLKEHYREMNDGKDEDCTCDQCGTNEDMIVHKLNSTPVCDDCEAEWCDDNAIACAKLGCSICYSFLKKEREEMDPLILAIIGNYFS